jgi:LuxR family transcriptional regulator, maltose regulon positive regulatory protein
MEDFILYPRITPPKTPENIVKRLELIQLLNNNSDKPLITVCAPAGYGKTTLIVDFINNCGTNNAWFHIQSDINNIYIFFSYLVHSLKQINPEFGENTLDIIESSRERYQVPKHLNQVSSLIVSTFVNEFSRGIKDDIILILDEMEQIEETSWLEAGLSKLLANLPQNLRLIITSRELPDIGIATLTAKRKVLKIQTEELTLKDNEVKELLKIYFGADFSDEEISMLGKSMGGWVTGIHLLLQAYGENFTKYKPEANILPEDIYFYFAEDIFRKQDNEIKDFLLNTTLLEDFTSSLCDEFLGIERSREILSDMLNKNIFISSSQSPNGETTYAYQILFKKFLTSKLEGEKSHEEILKLYDRIHKYYKEKGETDKAIRYAIHAENFKEAVKLITKHFEKIFEGGNFVMLWGWLELIPEQVYNENPELLYYKGLMTKFYHGNIEGSVPHMERAIKIIANNNNDDLFIKTKISLARIYISMGEIKKAMNDIKKLLKSNAGKSGEVKLLYLMAYGHYMSAEYDKSLKLLDKALSLDVKDIEVTNNIYNLLGHINLIKGEFIKSIAYYEKILLNDFSLIDKFETLCNLVLLNSQSGDFEKANKYLQMTREISENSPIPIFQIAHSLAEQAYYFEIGNYAEGIKVLTEMNTIAKRLNHKYYTYLSYRLIADSYYYSKKFTKAEEYYDLAFGFINEDSELESAEYAQMKAMLMKETGFRKDIEKTLLNVKNFYKENGFVYNEAQATFHLADFYLKAEKPDAAKEYITESLRAAFEKEYLSFLKREILFNPAIFDFCYSNNIEKNLIRDLKESIPESISTNGHDKTSTIKTGSLTSADQLTDLKMMCLGGLAFQKRSEKIDDKLWQKKKRKLILAYLMLEPGMEMTKDQVVDTFYPETPIDSVENIFYQSVSRLRKILTLEGGTSLIVYKDKSLKLNEDYIYYTDVGEFEELCRKAESSNNAIEKAELYKKALDLYKGSFMEGYYDDWVDEKRQMINNLFFNAGETLLEILEKQDNISEVVNYSRKIIDADNTNETAYESIIKALMKSGNAKGAEDTFKEMKRNFKKELGEEPDDRLIQRIQQILNAKRP